MMNGNETIIMDIASLSNDELAESYRTLSESYRALKRDHEAELQLSHELRRNYQTSSESIAYLTTELESIDAVHKAELAKLKEKYVSTLTTLKDSNADLKQQISGLETTVDELQKQRDDLRQKIDELESAGANADTATCNVTQSSESETFLERENEELKQLVSDQQEKIDTLMLQLVNSESKLENFKEKIECMEDNLAGKKQDLTEMQTLLDTAHEENMRLNSELAAFRTAPDDPNKKGNSLFAEVDDQRQKLIEMLESQRKHYHELKKLHSESQFQIRRLTRENKEICDEIQACSDLFVRANRNFQDESSKQILLLKDLNQRLQEQLGSAERRLIERAIDTPWMDSFVSFYKNESATLRTQLLQLQMSKRLVDEVCWDAQRDLAKWRFEALKSRYIIINRESLLEEHGIEFAPFDTMEAGIHINEVLVANAKPHVGFSTSANPVPKIEDRWKELDLLADLNIAPKLPVVEGINKETELMLAPPPPSEAIHRSAVKEEFLTPLATPLVTPVPSPKSLKKENVSFVSGTFSNAEKSGVPTYRDIVFSPKDAPIIYKKKQFSEMFGKVDSHQGATKKTTPAVDEQEKENVLQAEKDTNQQPQTSDGKRWGWISEKRTKNNIVIRRFKFPERGNTASASKQSK
ncbi:protein Spindly isoform X2 [Topomyia yanbarensis]|uniref:protein Spindly isoform X2 n=1 Tax=Topomyia yanbarensis TaxID=2498891 RepID=UPI00273ABE14|nr:protein Spindly isoform X2 [Topomyia yanbarensis]